ncbi:MAG: hypothetical protein NUW24_15955 [Anaerolineae bacterium]|jgi:hypothetical protein|nr:hypothetical protein [Anaerolineae bacterium]MDH7474044.1 hypothetical protein [Anaerolineae bacterium]
MVDLVNDLISVSELGGAIELPRGLVDVSRIVSEAVEACSVEAGGAGGLAIPRWNRCDAL